MKSIFYWYNFFICFSVLSFSFVLMFYPLFQMIDNKTFFIAFDVIYYYIMYILSHKLSISLV